MTKEKRCLGWYCDWRDRCTLYIDKAPPLSNITWFSPRHVGEHCDAFKPVPMDREVKQ